MIKIIIILPQQTYTLRKEVLRKNINLPYKFTGDFDKTTLHLGAFKNNTLCGIATLMQANLEGLSGNHYQLRGMATAPEVRGLGFGKQLLNASFTILKDKKVDAIWCNARKVALEFYQQKGFKIIGKPFEILQIGTHYKMYKKLM